MSQQEQPQPRDWNKIVTDSNGDRIFLPDEFRADAEKVEKLRKEFNDLIATVAEKEINLNMSTQNMFWELRKHLAKQGVAIWTKDIGFDTEALKDGKFVINLRENQK